ncbi:hypothetical protein SAMN02990966_03725 [Rhodospirillales bacterium URHD0017]|nr:hypothetical protein SAMN02990966_03725 [Rhodospirillales bacterium URHD0017]
MLRRALLVFTAAAICSTPLWAQETRRVRATIEKVDGSTLFVKTRDGEDLKITLSDKPLFVAIVPATLADLKPGAFVGSGATPGPDGSLVALEVHIFPESMRGTGEGHRPMEGTPQATMTNANVDVSVAAVDGQMLTLKYKDGEKKLLVTPKTVIVAYAPGDRAELKPGIKFFAVAQKQPDGSLQAARISYGRDGLTPPM